MKKGSGKTTPTSRGRFPRQQGLSLIELMIAMLLGLLVLGAAIGIFLSNRQIYRTTESLGGMQESLQTAFELMAREVREAGENPCDVNLAVANVVNNATASWWTNWGTPLQGFDNGALTGSVTGTDAIQVLGPGDALANVVSHTDTTLTVDDASSFSTGNTLMVCDTAQLAIFKASSTSGTTVGHDSGGGNCGNSLNTKPAACSSVPYLYPRNALLSRLVGTRWFVADNGRGGRSLYRVVDGGSREEMVEGISDMQIDYLQGSSASSYQAADAIANWGGVTAVRIALTAQSTEATGTGSQRLQRTLEHVVTLRSRTQ